MKGQPIHVQSPPIVAGVQRTGQSPTVRGSPFAGNVSARGRPHGTAPRMAPPASREPVVQIRYAPPPPLPPPPPPGQMAAPALSNEINEANEAAAILAQAKGAVPHPHPSFLYQPPRIYYPHYPLYYPAYYPTEYTDESSRAAFEKLVYEPSQDWSQMSPVQRMIDNDTDESMVASTIVTQLAKSPAKPSVRGNRAATSSSIGQAEKETTQSVSFLTGVLKRTKAGKDGAGALSKKPPPANAKPPPLGSPSRVVQGTQTTFESPNKRKAPYQSPLNHGGTFPEPGTPIGMAAGFRSGLSPASGLNTLSTFPDGSSPFSNHLSGYSRDGHSVDFHDAFSSAAGNFEGHQADSPDNSPDKASRRTSLFGDGATLMENDLEAISALNSLSHSPAKFLATRSKTEAGADRDGGAQRKSLFAKVVGGSDKDKDASSSPSNKKRKLKF